MNIQDKTREELIVELLKLQHEHDELKKSYEKILNLNLTLINGESTEQVDLVQVLDHFELISHSSPDAALITRLSDGLVVAVNDRFTQITGFTREESIGASSIATKLWKNPDARAVLVNELLQNGFCDNWEVDFVRKDGGMLVGLLSAKKIIINGVPHIFSITRDITARKKAEIESIKIQKLLEDSQRIGKVGGWEFNIDTNELKWTREMYNIHEVDFTFIPVVDQRSSFYTPESLVRIDIAVQRAMEFGEPYEVISEIITAKGNHRTIKSIGEPDLSNRRIFGLFQDITEQKQAERALLQSEEKFRTLFANMIDGSALHSLVYNEKGIAIDYRILEVNPAFESLLGISRDSVINKTSREAYGVDEPPYFELYSNVALSGSTEVFETYFAPLNKYFSISVYCPFKDGFVTIFEDITKRKMAELELKASEEKFRLLFEKSPDPIVITNNNGDFVDCNPAVLKDMEFESLSELKNYNALDFYCIEDARERLLGQLMEVGYIHDIQLNLQSPNKSEISDYLGSVETLKFADKESFFIVWLKNITERNRIEQNLIRSEIELKRAEQFTHIGSFFIDLKTNKVSWTEELYKMYGYDPSLSVPLLDDSQKLFTPESWELLSNSIANTVKTGEPYNVELQTIRIDGTQGWMWALGEAIVDADGKIANLWGAVQDITEQKQIEAELNLKNEQLKELNATKDKFLSIMAHDLKTPFNGILGFSDLLKENASELDVNTIETYAENINRTAKQTYKLLENLLDWSKMQRNGLQIENKILIFNNLLQSVLDELKQNAVSKNISVINEIAYGIIFKADAVMLGSVLRNLVNNAIKFTRKGGKITISSKMRNNKVEISISDTGIGMDKETIGKLFKIETSFSSVGTQNEKGTGLGLLLSKEIVEKHGGNLWVESEKDKGSIFTFSIPLEN